ncbi:hypothetical protein B0H10DRAFT_2191080 [Mycena sp. CBHHK59/15]|nr:hypothetical protein B0H10DRAFT_2191080 [Mycena sp. CBHHK59/15]
MLELGIESAALLSQGPFIRKFLGCHRHFEEAARVVISAAAFTHNAIFDAATIQMSQPMRIERNGTVLNGDFGTHLPERILSRALSPDIVFVSSEGKVNALLTHTGFLASESASGDPNELMIYQLDFELRVSVHICAQPASAVHCQLFEGARRVALRPNTHSRALPLRSSSGRGCTRVHYGDHKLCMMCSASLTCIPLTLQAIDPQARCGGPLAQRTSFIRLPDATDVKRAPYNKRAGIALERRCASRPRPHQARAIKHMIGRDMKFQPGAVQRRIGETPPISVLSSGWPVHSHLGPGADRDGEPRGWDVAVGLVDQQKYKE